MDMAASGTRRLLWPAVIVALVVLLIAFSVLAAKYRESLLAAKSQTLAPAPSVLAAPSQPPPAAPPLLSAPSRPTPPAPALTNAPSVTPPGMPADVAAYLKFLQGIEERRVALNNDASGATAMLNQARGMQGDQGDPEAHNENAPGNVAKISGGYGDYSVKWQTLTRDFRAVVPPQPCALLANQYLQFLTGYAATISQLQVALQNGDLGAAMGVQGAQKKLNADAVKADDALAQLCQRYSAPKPFTIQPDGGGGSSLLGM